MCPPTVAAFSITQTLNSSLPAWKRDGKLGIKSGMGIIRTHVTFTVCGRVLNRQAPHAVLALDSKASFKYQKKARDLRKIFLKTSKSPKKKQKCYAI
jgi:hypothetical protein